MPQINDPTQKQLDDVWACFHERTLQVGHIMCQFILRNQRIQLQECCGFVM